MMKPSKWFAPLTGFIRRHPVISGIVGFFVLSSALTGTVVGRVTDAETGEPVEGAVVMAVWASEIGIPLFVDAYYRFGVERETVSGKGGRFFFFRPRWTIGKYPSVTVYKEGYVVWSSKYAFDAKPGDNVRKEKKKRPIRFRMRAALRPWAEGMSHGKQSDFINERFNESWQTKGYAPRMKDAYWKESNLSYEAKQRGETP